MDTLTHALLGAAIGQVSFGHRLGWRAVAVAVIAAELPDLDFLIRSDTDPLLNIEYHRHLTHSFALSPLGALLAAAPWVLRERFRAQWRDFWLCGLLAFWSHILLDACTSYGTQLFRPFSDTRIGWDLISIIDPIFTGALLAGVVASLWRKSTRPSLVTLGFCAAYLALGGIQKARALRTQEQLARARSHVITRSEVMPTLGNHLVWRSLYRHEGLICSDRIRVGWLSSPSVREGTSLAWITAADLSPEERARNQPGRSFERFNWFSEGWVARAPADPTFIGDMRYSLSSEAFDPIWGIRFMPAGAPVAVEWVNRSRQRRLGFGDLWRELTGADPAYRPIAKAPAAPPAK